jgi:uncharacterized membrane protein
MDKIITPEVLKLTTDFGNEKAEKNNISFVLKILLYAVIGAVLGLIQDKTMKRLQDNKILGESSIIYILIQIITNLAVIISIRYSFRSFSEEFQQTISGIFYVWLYCSVQSNFMNNIVGLV